jgi:hypothetical protein
VKRGLQFWALVATLFAIRWWVLGGIGGYVDPRNGKAEVFQLGVLAAAKAACFTEPAQGPTDGAVGRNP